MAYWLFSIIVFPIPHPQSLKRPQPESHAQHTDLIVDTDSGYF